MLNLTAASAAPTVAQRPRLPRAAGCPPDRRAALGAVVGLHLLGIWGVLQMPVVRHTVREVAPLMVHLVTLAPDAAAAPAPAPVPAPAAATAAPTAPVQRTAAAPPAEPAAPTPPPTAPQPLATAATETATPQAQAPVAVAPAALEPPPPTTLEPRVTAATAATVATAPAPPARAAPPRKVVAAHAVRYLVEPPVEVPRASRRAGEHGTVWLRVVVSTQGLPVQVSVARSSGHSRLDEQALWAMRQARFQPHTEDGRAMEVEVTAAIEYPLD